MKPGSSVKLGVIAFIVSFGALGSGRAAAQDVIAGASTDGVNMWDGQWHFDLNLYGWVPFIYSTVQLPPIAGGGNPTIETEPSQYLKYVKAGALLDGSVQKGDWGIWTDLLYLNLESSPTHTKQIGLPGVDATVPVSLTLNSDVRAAIWSLTPSYTVVHNDTGNLDLIAGFRYVSLRLSLAYELSVPPLHLARGGGFWPNADATDAIVGVKGSLRLSKDGKWFLPYEADVGDGNKNWQWNAILGVGYHFHWGAVTLGCRNFTYNRTGDVIVQKERFTGPVFGAMLRW
jgi:hypothetical protein